MGYRGSGTGYRGNPSDIPYQEIHNVKHVEKLLIEADPYIVDVLRLLIDSHSVLAREILRGVHEKHSK